MSKKRVLFFLMISIAANLLAYNRSTEAKEWCLALTGVMTESNKALHTTLNTGNLTPEYVQNIKDMLKRDWKIKNRTDLINTLERTETDGHSKEFAKIMKQIKKSKDHTIFYSINTLHLTSTQYNYFLFLGANYELYKGRSLICWDLGRDISLCRWGYDAGYLTEEEAWYRIFYYAGKIQKVYKSWEDYGSDYVLGRVFWASGFGKEVDYLQKTWQIYKKLMSPIGIWHNRAWDVNLER